MSPKVAPEHVAQRRRQIIDGAVACFARGGYAGTSIEDVAAECGLSVGSIYTYFPGKEQLFLALAVEQLERFDSEIGDVAAAAPDAAGALRAAIGHFLDRVAVEAEAYGHLYFEFRVQARDQPGLAEPVRDLMARVQAQAAALVTRGVAEGAFRPGIDAEATGYVISALLEGYALHVATAQPTIAPSRLLDAVFALLE